MNGSNARPMNAVNNRSTATLFSLKKRSTMYLSKCTEIAQSTGPEKAKKSQDILFTLPCRGRVGRGTAGVRCAAATPYHPQPAALRTATSPSRERCENIALTPLWRGGRERGWPGARTADRRADQ